MKNVLQSFFIYDFLKMGASEILSFLSFFRQFVFKIMSVWAKFFDYQVSASS
jgi:hypothetical protein